MHYEVAFDVAHSGYHRWTFPECAGTAAGTYTDCRHLRDALDNGRYLTVEGPVTQLVPMPWQGHAMEHFEVNGHRYAYSDYVVTAGVQSHAVPRWTDP
jgi:hypothetical protein